MPKEREWVVFAQWGQKYGRKLSAGVAVVCSFSVFTGKVFSLSIFGRPFIIVNSTDVLEELETKGANFSDRPVLPMGGVLLGFDQTVILAPYGSRWRTFRKYFTRAFGPGKRRKQAVHPARACEAGSDKSLVPLS